MKSYETICIWYRFSIARLEYWRHSNIQPNIKLSGDSIKISRYFRQRMPLLQCYRSQGYHLVTEGLWLRFHGRCRGGDFRDTSPTGINVKNHSPTPWGSNPLILIGLSVSTCCVFGSTFSLH